jgi:hypothetical protein
MDAKVPVVAFVGPFLCVLGTSVIVVLVLLVGSIVLHLIIIVFENKRLCILR